MRRLHARRSRRAEVTVCVPAYEAERFVAETLASVQNQRYKRLRVLVSVDASVDATEAECRRFERDPRFSVHAQSERLGWVRNINFLLDRVETELFMILPHDDLLDRDYVRALGAEAQTHPEAPVVYCDIAQVHRGTTRLLSTPSLDRPLAERVAALLATPGHEGVPWRGITRTAVLRRGLRMRDNAFDGYGAHVLWVLELLCLAPFRHVPRSLYRRLVRDEATTVVSGQWLERPENQRLAAWVDHSIAALRVLAGAEASSRERARMLAVQIARTLDRYPRAVRIRESEEAARRTRLAIVSELVAAALGAGDPAADTLAELRAYETVWGPLAELTG